MLMSVIQSTLHESNTNPEEKHGTSSDFQLNEVLPEALSATLSNMSHYALNMGCSICRIIYTPMYDQ